MAGSKGQRLAGWILSGLLALFLIVVSASGKFVEWEGKDKMFEHIGFTNDQIMQIGVLEIVLTILFVIPRTSFLGAILLTGYLGGAVVTHLRVGDPYFFPIILGVVMWIAYGLRQPAVFALAFGSTPRASSP
jgi:hypothetical protein